METLSKFFSMRRCILFRSLVLIGLGLSACTSDFPLADPGPYAVSQLSVETVDPTRDNRPVGITYWYPADKQKAGKFDPDNVAMNLPPDRSGAPYPLILSSTVMAKIFAPYLVSHGFTWASVDRINTYRDFGEKSIDQPKDLLFVLEQAASNPPSELDGMINSDQAGTIGYSFDGYNSLAVSGARVDPSYYLAQCPVTDETTQAIVSDLSAYDCTPAENWEAFNVFVGEKITSSEDGLWQPMTDPRIRAVMPLAGEGWWLFGEKGLAAVDRPILMMAGTQDELYEENAFIYDHLGTLDRTFISFLDRDHMMMVEDEDNIRKIAHFATAFFGYHLQKKGELAVYYAQEFVAQFEDLAWGTLKKNEP